MPSGIKPMTPDQIDAFLKSQRVGLLSLTDTKSAYAIPLGYSYNGKDINLTMGHKGRKMDYIKSCSHACFTVYWLSENFGPRNGMSYKSVICDGVLEHITDPEEITKAVRETEKHLELPAGAWDHVLERTLEDTSNSAFWKINVTQIGSRVVDDFKGE